jgi:hypothetical protein
MTRTRMITISISLVLLLAVYAVGPSLLAPQSDTAADRCADSVSSDSSSIHWRLFPVAGWICEDASGRDKYLGWWA